MPVTTVAMAVTTIEMAIAVAMAVGSVIRAVLIPKVTDLVGKVCTFLVRFI